MSWFTHLNCLEIGGLAAAVVFVFVLMILPAYLAGRPGREDRRVAS